MVIATLDTVPDPPAVNPTTALCKVVQPDECSCDTIVGRSDSFGTSYHLPVSLIASDADEPYRPSDRMVLTGLVTDPSPPALGAAR